MHTLGCLAIACFLFFFLNDKFENIGFYSFYGNYLSSYGQKSLFFLRPIINWNSADPEVRTANQANLSENGVKYN